jgi:hypothetical protein
VVPAETVVGDAIVAAHALGALRAGAVRRTKDLARGEVARRIRDTLAPDMATLGPPAN